MQHRAAVHACVYACLPPVCASCFFFSLRACAWVCILCSGLQCHKSQSWCNTVGSGVWALPCVRGVRKAEPRELLQRISKSLCFWAKPIITGAKSFPKNKLLFGTVENPLNVSCFFLCEDLQSCIFTFLNLSCVNLFLCCHIFGYERLLYEAKNYILLHYACMMANA